MKKTIITCALMALVAISANAQDKTESVFKYDKYGNIESVLFSKNDREYENLKSVDVFFKNILKVKTNNTFVMNRNVILEKGHETYEQFYKGIKVEDAGYTFHYDEDGHIKYAHGNYVDISSLDINPSISKDDAAKAFAKFKGLAPDSITQSSTELIIKRIRGVHPAEIPLLVYKVTIEVKNVCVMEYGYVDAKTGDVEDSESYIYDIATTGTFYTKYYGTKYATANYENGCYYLEDPSRGNGIVIRDLNNYCLDYSDYQLHETRIMDSDNNWYYSDYTDSTFMAYDVNWAFQMIYDRLYNVHGKNSMDNNGKLIKAYVKAVIDEYSGDTNNACWVGSREEFYFGIGSDWNRPVSSLDVVAHEYGHGITKFQIGWSYIHKFLNEGLSDIWAAIMDYRFGDANTEVWKIGEHLIPSCTYLRDLEYPENPNAYTQIASTYNSTFYNNCSSSYGKSGVFSHWFYLLVNGGQGYNANGAYYNLKPIGMDVAENLIVKAVFDNYLRYKTSYEGVREAFVAAAEAMNIDGLVSAVCNAWYAVGVGDMNWEIDGPTIPESASVYQIFNLPIECSVVWSFTGTNWSTASMTTNSPAQNQCTIDNSSKQYIKGTLMAVISRNGAPTDTLTKVIDSSVNFSGTYAQSSYYYTNPNWYYHGTSATTFHSGDRFYLYKGPRITLTSNNFIGANVTYLGNDVCGWTNNNNGKITFYFPYNENPPLAFAATTIKGTYSNNYEVFQFNVFGKRPIGTVHPMDRGMSLTLTGNSCVVSIESSENLSEILDETWTLSVINATTNQCVVTTTVNGVSRTIDIGGWPKGIYIVKATWGNEKLTEKFVLK